MSMRVGVISGYASQVYVLILGMAFVPLYIRFMGVEAYGLVGFFTMLQAWFGVLDLGLSATASREATLYKNQQIDAKDFADFCRGLAWIFGGISLLGALVLLLSAPWISHKWLVVHELQPDQVVLSVQVMAICVALKLSGGIYRGMVTGNEWLPWLNAFNALAATAKFAGVFLSMLIWGFSPVVFFLHQLVVGLLEWWVLWFKARTLVPVVSRRHLLQTFAAVWTRLKFMLSMAFVSVVWVMVSQLDKLVLSGVLSLQDYAYFTVAMVVANGITFLTGPVSAAVMPRMTGLYSQKSELAMLTLYRKATRYLIALTGPVAALMALYAQELLWVWTGDHNIALHAAPVLSLYSIGNGVLAMGGFAYYLQYAKGQLRYHVLSSILFVTLLMPALIFAAISHGAKGAGWVWLVFNVLYLLLWVAFVHSRLAPGLHLVWLLCDGFAVILPSVALLLICRQVFVVSTLDRWLALVQLVLVCTGAMLTSLLALRDFRSMLTQKFRPAQNSKSESSA